MSRSGRTPNPTRRISFSSSTRTAWVSFFKSSVVTIQRRTRRQSRQMPRTRTHSVGGACPSVPEGEPCRERDAQHSCVGRVSNVTPKPRPKAEHEQSAFDHGEHQCEAGERP
eukprot:scaffold279_cov229-Pinguiococcus_pyrenoidosus.AAC.19